MTSTTLDVALCILLVSAAAATLATSTPPASTPDRTDAVAEVLATSTTAIEYTLAPGVRDAAAATDAAVPVDGPEFQRSSHGTLAGLAADAALGNLTVGGAELTATSDDFERAVRRAILTTFASSDLQLIAVWRPYPESHVGGRFVAGSSPPPTRDGHVATLSVPSGFPSARAAAMGAADSDGFDGVARVIATRIVTGLFPPTQTSLALGDDYPVALLVTHRYRRLARLYGTDATDIVDRAAAKPADADVEAMNRQLVAAMAPTIERELRRGFETPTAAAQAVRLTTVRLVIRTWS